MNDAVQIRSCNGALRAEHCRFRPSFPPTPPARHPSLKISNRESLRRVRADDSARRNDEQVHLTHTKHTISRDSNRENSACFSNHDQPARHPILKISNRESLRFPHRSKRENDAGFSMRVRGVTTRRSSISEFNKQSRKRTLKAPSKNVSVRKKSAERFQQLTQILIERMFRLEIPPGRRTTERETAFGHRQEGELCQRMYGASRGMLAPVCWGTRRGV